MLGGLFGGLFGSLAAADPGAIELTGVAARAQSADPASTDLVIKSPDSSWDLAGRSAVFSGGVVVQRGDLTLTCATLTVTYGDDNTFRTASASGAVIAERPPYRAGGEAAVLDVRDGALTLTGDPWLRDGSSALSGSQIVFRLDDERVDCKDCRLVVGAELLNQQR